MQARAFKLVSLMILFVVVLAACGPVQPAKAPVKITDQGFAILWGVAWTPDSRDIVYGAGGRWACWSTDM